MEWYNQHIVRVVDTSFDPGGIYSGTYNCTVSGAYRLSVTGGDSGQDHILGSPFTVQIDPDITVPWNSIAFGPGLDEGLPCHYALKFYFLYGWSIQNRVSVV